MFVSEQTQRLYSIQQIPCFDDADALSEAVVTYLAVL